MPTFIRTTYDQYASRQDVRDYYARYKSLESVYAATIKYVGTTFALIAADHDSSLKNDVWGRIFESSSLGGWLDAVDLVCMRSQTLRDSVKGYCDNYSMYKKHPSRNSLDGIANHLTVVVEELARRGYEIETPKSLSIRRSLRYVVTVRNKCAHGALDELFFSRVEGSLVKALKLILRLIPFSEFVFWGQFGGNAVEFLENPPAQRPHRRTCYFWAESDLLARGFAERVPFLLYRQDSRTIYFLNDKASEDNPTAEYIDYVTGQIVYRPVEHEWPQAEHHTHKAIDLAQYNRYTATLASCTLTWREVPLTRVSVDAASDETGVYMFTTAVSLGGRQTDVVLYVGKTNNLRDRLASYVRIKKGYDDRPAITHMLSTYHDSLRLLFAPVAASQLAAVERALYETTMPTYNLIAPPAGERERT